VRTVVAFGFVVLVAAGCGSDTTTVIQQAPVTVTQTQTAPSTTSTESSTTAEPEGTECGIVMFSGTATTIVALRGVECPEAVRVAGAYDSSSPPTPWQCGLAHEPFDSFPLADGSKGVIGFSCGFGGSGDLRAAPHAFLGVLPE
jgi:hypothetical protein